MDERAAEDTHHDAHEPHPHPRPRHTSRCLEESLLSDVWRNRFSCSKRSESSNSSSIDPLALSEADSASAAGQLSGAAPNGAMDGVGVRLPRVAQNAPAIEQKFACERLIAWQPGQ